jgi:hypothetical protein
MRVRTGGFANVNRAELPQESDYLNTGAETDGVSAEGVPFGNLNATISFIISTYVIYMMCFIGYLNQFW